MAGFAAASREVTIPAPDPVVFELALLPFEEIARTAVRAPARGEGAPSGRRVSAGASERRADAAARTSGTNAAAARPVRRQRR